MSRGYLIVFSGLAAAIGLAGCSSVPYSPRPLDPEATESAFLARSADVDGLKRFAAANGYAPDAWPPPQWGLKELTLLALYFHADIRTARARAEVARAEFGSAVQPQSWSERLSPGYHSRPLPDSSAPWTLGLELEIPLVAQGKRAARAERGAFLADAAELDVANAAWMVRSRVRDRYQEMQASQGALALLDAQLLARRDMLDLVNRRVDAGMLSARDLGIERVAHSQVELLRSQELARQQRAKAELAAALGLSLEVVDRMNLRVDADASPRTEFDTGALRRMALRNRLDVHRKLLEFGAADAEVKAAVAAQNPDVTLGPGYTWDQGDNVWSLAVSLSLPRAAQMQASIREAQARRELAAEQFAATQLDAISAAERAGAQYRLALDRVAGSEHQLQIQREQESRINRQFETGAADRMQRVAARLDTLASETMLQAALVDARQAVAHLEDALQRPLLGDFETLPDVKVTRSAEVINNAGINKGARITKDSKVTKDAGLTGDAGATKP
ncbi:MAG TPA: TolC family protein [Burkholderiales bacterium]|nr:TolC family protein [Burkholderiales bacterium]